MKICYLAPANNPHTIKWCNYFKSKGHEVYLISFVPGNVEGIITHNILFDKGIENKGNFVKLKYILQINKIKRIIEDIKPDILHAHYATSYGIIGSLSNYHPYILSVWGSDVYDFPQISPFHKKLVEYNLKKADYILSTSFHMKKETEKYTNKHIEITPFGVDVNKFKPIPSFKSNNRDQFVIGTIKTLKPKYGIEYLIKAFKILKRSYPEKNLKLKIAGKGEQKEELQQLCRDLQIQADVEFLGFLPEQEVIHTFNTFDVAVFPSDSESFGVAAVEAQACGLPVIVSNVGGLPEATSPNITSLLVERKNEKELANAIERLMLDDKLRKKLGINARSFVLEHYNIEDNFKDVETLYQKVVNNNEV